MKAGTALHAEGQHVDDHERCNGRYPSGSPATPCAHVMKLGAVDLKDHYVGRSLQQGHRFRKGNGGGLSAARLIDMVEAG